MNDDVHKLIGFMISGLQILDGDIRTAAKRIIDDEAFMFCPTSAETDLEAEQYFLGFQRGIKHAIEMLCAESIAKLWKESSTDGKRFVLQ